MNNFKLQMLEVRPEGKAWTPIEYPANLETLTELRMWAYNYAPSIPDTPLSIVDERGIIPTTEMYRFSTMTNSIMVMTRRGWQPLEDRVEGIRHL